MKNRLPDSSYVNRRLNNKLTNEELKYALLMKNSKSKYLGITQLGKLTKIAEYLNISIEVVLDEIINAAYDLLPNTVKQPSTNKIKRLIIPSNITEFRDLMDYLNTDFNNHNQFTFNLHSYNLLAEDIKRHKIAPSNLRDYLKYNYPTTTVTIKD